MRSLTFLPYVPQASHHKQGSGALTEGQSGDRTEGQTKCPGHTEQLALTGQGEGRFRWTLKMLTRQLGGTVRAKAQRRMESGPASGLGGVRGGGPQARARQLKAWPRQPQAKAWPLCRSPPL